MKKNDEFMAQDVENEKVLESKQNACTRGHNLRRMVCVFIICIFAAFGLFYYFKIYEGKFKVEVVADTFEIGDNRNLMKTLKVDSRNIKDFSIVKDGGFTTDKVGNYIVVYDVINKRGNHKELSFTYHVVDTVAPVIKLLDDEVYLAKGSRFEIEQYVSVEDLSETTSEYTGVFDPDKEGNYIIEVFAKDSSGNVSNKEKLHIIVEDRSNCDIRKAKFGETKEVVKRYETSQLVDEEENIIYYKTILNGLEADLFYWFNDQNQLYQVSYKMEDYLIDEDVFISEYNKLVGELTNKYGVPDESTKYNKSSIGLDDGTALWLGDYVQGDRWYLDNMGITTYLGTLGTSEIKFWCLYSSNEYQEEQQENNDL